MTLKVKKQLVIYTERASKNDLLGFIFADGTCIMLALDPNHTPSPEDPDYHMIVRKAPLHLEGATEELTESDKELMQSSVIRIRKIDLIPRAPLKGKRQSPHNKTDFETFIFAGGSPLSGVFPVNSP